MDAKEIEAEALKLDSRSRARLATTLLGTLDKPAEEDCERVWAEEAQRRDAEMDADPESGVPAAEVFREARSRAK